MDLEFDPFSEEMMEDPYPTYRRLRKHAPVYFNKLRNFWAVTQYEHSRTVLKNWQVFSNEDGVELDGTSNEFFGASNFLMMDPPDHTRIRKIFAPAFTPAAIRPLESQTQEVADRLLAEFVEAGKADFAKDYCWPLPIEVISFLLGVPPADRPWVTERVLKAFKREPGFEGLPEAALESASQVREYFGAGVAERRVKPTDDLLSRVANGESLRGEPMTPDEVGGLCLLLFAAGIITTGSFLSNSLLLLMDQDDQRRDLIEHPEITPQAVEELWRLENPVQNTGRTAHEDVMLGGQQIRAGDRVAIFTGSANRDELIWDNAETLDIRRPYQRSMIFGDGVHVCLGNHLARLEGRIGLDTILARIPQYELAGEIGRTDRVNERGLVSLPVRF
jgi:cytochrome P450